MGQFAAMLPMLGKAAGMAAASTAASQGVNAGANALFGPETQSMGVGVDPAAQQAQARHQMLAALMQQMQQQQMQGGPQATQMESRAMTPMPDIQSIIAALSQRRV